MLTEQEHWAACGRSAVTGGQVVEHIREFGGFSCVQVWLTADLVGELTWRPVGSKFLFSAHGDISMQGGDWSKKIYRSRINTSRAAAEDLKRQKNTTRFCFSLNCSKTLEEVRVLSRFLLVQIHVGQTLKIPHPHSTMCVGRGSSVVLYAPQHGLLSQYRAQTTATLSSQLLNWKLSQTCLCCGP